MSAGRRNALRIPARFQPTRANRDAPIVVSPAPLAMTRTPCVAEEISNFRNLSGSPSFWSKTRPFPSVAPAPGGIHPHPPTEAARRTTSSTGCTEEPSAGRITEHDCATAALRRRDPQRLRRRNAATAAATAQCGAAIIGKAKLSGFSQRTGAKSGPDFLEALQESQMSGRDPWLRLTSLAIEE